MPVNNKRILDLVVLGTVALGGCMVGPDYRRTESAAEQADTYQWIPPGWVDTNDPCAPGRWWETFHDPVIDEIVTEVLAHNTDLHAAIAARQRAEAIVRQAYGLRWPEVTYGAEASRSRVGFDASFFPGADFVSFYSSGYNHGLNVTYVTDIFGRLQRTHRAALQDLQANKADQQALAHGIVAGAIDLRIQIATAQKTLGISDATIDSWVQSVAVIEQRYEGGLVSPVDVYLVKERLAEARASKSRSEEAIILLKHALDVMRGQIPQGRVTLDRTLSALPPLDTVPVGLPAHLLRRRPDVCAAEWRVAAATERIGVSMAERYPDLVLNTGFGYSSNEFEKLLEWKYRTLLAAAQVSAPIFNAGRLRAGVQAAEAAAQEATQRYVGTVLQAVGEVEDALAREQTLTVQLGHIKEQLQLASEAERLSRDRYARGVDTILVVLESERQRRLAEIQVALAEGDLWRNRVALFLALGGDWGLEEADVAAENESTPEKSP